MTNAPDDYREPKITTVPAKKSSASYIPWLLLALGILVFLAWLFGAFDTNKRIETGATQPASVSEQPASPPPANGTAPAN